MLVGLASALFLLTDVIGPRMLIIPLRVKNTAAWTPQKYGLEGEYLQFKTPDDNYLSGYLSKSKQGQSRGVLIVCHGLGSCKEHQFSLSKWFNKLGYDVLVFDSRAHGKSTGEYCTYGYYEKRDVSVIIDQLEGQGEKNFYIFGTSLGAGIALQALAIESRLRGGIIVSGFSSLEEVSFDYQKRLTKIPSKWVNDRVNAKAGAMANFEPQAVNPEQACALITQPVLIIHGEEDKRIDPQCAQRNYKALASIEKQLIMVPQAGHNDVLQVGGQELVQNIVRFVNEKFDQN